MACCEPFSTVRDLINFLNDNNIPKDSIVDILEKSGLFLLIYYK